jgi:hypothetical protein
MKNNALKFILIFLIIIVSCEKENVRDNFSQKELFNAPNISTAQDFFDKKSQTTSNFINKSSINSLLTDWQYSKIIKYKSNSEVDIDILYTPIYLNTSKNAKAFIASTEQNGTIDSKIIFVLQKSTNDLSAYVFIYNLDGMLEFEYNFEDGQVVPFTENQNTVSLKTSAGCQELPNLTTEELMEWLQRCTVALDEVVVIGQLPEIDAGDSASGGGFDIPSSTQINPWDYSDDINGPNSNGSNPLIIMPNEVSASGLSIRMALGLPSGSLISHWLTQQSNNNQNLLNAIAQFLNNNKVPSPNPLFSNINSSQLISIESTAVDYILNIINGLMNNPQFDSSDIDLDTLELLEDYYVDPPASRDEITDMNEFLSCINTSQLNKMGIQ